MSRIKYHNFKTGNSHLDETLENYLIHGIPPGGFATSLLANDLFLAASRADSWNRPRLAELVIEVYARCPSVAIGSYDAVAHWLADRDGQRSRYADAKEKELAMRILRGENVKEEKPDYPF